MTDDAIASLQATRAALIRDVEAIDRALKELGALNDRPSFTGSLGRRAYQVGDDKIDAVLEYIQKAGGRARQADIVRDLDINSGTASTALRALEAEGQVAKGPKQNRSATWQLVAGAA